MHYLKYKNFLILLSCLVLFPFTVRAATLYLDPAQGDYGPGDTIIAKIKLDNEGECINAIESGIAFSENLRAVDFSIGESIVNIWIEKPDTGDMNKINIDRKINFSGGIPGGYCGGIKGDIGESNIVGEVIFSVLGLNGEGQDRARVEIMPESRLLINDGKGTPAELKLTNAEFSILAGKSQETDRWQARIDEDDIAAEPFTIELLGGQNIFEGKYFIVFLAQDKQTGIDHYEVLEIRPEQEESGSKNIFSYLFTGKEPQWKTAQSPHLLEDQSLQSNIYVKAVDKAGNERTVKYFPEGKTGNKLSILSQLGGNMLLLIVAVFVILVIAAAIIAVKAKRGESHEKK